MSVLHGLIHTDPGTPWWSLVIRAIVVYVAVLVLLRISGKRQVGQMGMTEFVALLLISNAVQNSMNGGDNSLVGGLILAVVIIAMATLFAYATYRSSRFEKLVQGRPTLLIHQGKIIHKHLANELLSERELKQLLRKQGVHEFDEIAEAVLESDGFISIVHKSEIADEEYQQRNDVY